MYILQTVLHTFFYGSDEENLLHNQDISGITLMQKSCIFYVNKIQKNAPLNF